MRYDPDMGHTLCFIRRVNNLKFQVASFLLKIHLVFSPRGRHQLKPEPTQEQLKDVHISKQGAEGFGQVPGAGGSTSSGITGVCFGTLMRGWSHPLWPGRSCASEGVGVRKEGFFPLVVKGCWRTLGHPQLAAGEAVTGVQLLMPHLKKGKIQEIERKGKCLKAWGLKPHSTSLVLPLNHGQYFWSLYT